MYVDPIVLVTPPVLGAVMASVAEARPASRVPMIVGAPSAPGSVVLLSAAMGSAPLMRALLTALKTAEMTPRRHVATASVARLRTVMSARMTATHVSMIATRHPVDRSAVIRPARLVRTVHYARWIAGAVSRVALARARTRAQSAAMVCAATVKIVGAAPRIAARVVPTVVTSSVSRLRTASHARKIAVCPWFRARTLIAVRRTPSPIALTHRVTAACVIWRLSAVARG